MFSLNPFYIYLILQIFMIVLSFLIGGFLGLFLFFLQAFVAILLLELVNYIEHYGLSRKILKNGKEFSRFRLGIKPSYTDNTILSQFVLMHFTKGEAEVFDEVLPIWLESLKLAIDKGVDIAMNFTNKKLKNEYNQNQ